MSAGTTIVRGRGRAVVTATGAASAMGRIAALMGGRQGLTPLQRRLAGVGRVLAVAAVVLSAIVLVIGLARGQDAELMVVTAISLVVAAVPESLPAVVTLALALGARRMSARHALIRRLPAVETLGSVTVLGTDKTGTLTQGNMVVRRLWTPDGGDAEISGTGYGPDGELTRSGRPVDPGQAADLGRLLTAGALCNDAALRPPDGGQEAWTAVGDPTEAALLAAAVKSGLDPGELTARFPRVAELPFDSDRKRMTTAHRLPDGGVRVICKGAPEVVLAPDFIAGDAAALRRAAERAAELARGGFRVLAVAAADRPGLPDPPGPDMEHGLRLLGLTAILDPPRPAAAATIASCQAAGITPVLITGDHPATAGAIARELGIIGDDAEVVDCGADGHAASFGTARVFARATPEQKLTIIAARQAAGDVVAMTGDGVNDGPALRRADIGVAMGKRGTEVARQAADLVLADDELGTVVAAAEEGGGCTPTSAGSCCTRSPAAAPRSRSCSPGRSSAWPCRCCRPRSCGSTCSPTGCPASRWAASPPTRPRCAARRGRPAESVLGAGLWQRIVRVGVVITAVTLAVALWGHATGRPWQSMAFFALGTTQLAVALGSRARPGTLANPALLWAVAGALGLQFAALYLPFLNDLLKTQPLTGLDLLVVCALSTLGYAAIRLDRVVHRDGRWRPRRRRPGAP